MGELNDTIDPREFRNALGAFATGITIVTTLDQSGQPAGMTVNSFNSVSLDPPLVLWSVDRKASLFSAFEQAERFVVHVLTAQQKHLSDAFYQKPAQERFAGLELESGLGGLPLIAGCAARFECRVEARHPGGDHVILLGRVERFESEREPQSPILYHAGGYRLLAD